MSFTGSALFALVVLHKILRSKDNLNFARDVTPEITDEQLAFYSKWTGQTDREKNVAHILSTWRSVKEKFHTYRCIQTLSYLSPKAKNLEEYSK